jgi:hypothetical protein
MGRLAMNSNVAFQPIDVATASPDSEGRLVLLNGALAAVLVRLEDDTHGADVQGLWFVEAAFGALSGLSGNATFATLEEAASSLIGTLA